MTFKTGEQHYKSKLTVDDVRLIRELKGELPIREIAKKFDVSHHCVYQISTYKTWKHVR